MRAAFRLGRRPDNREGIERLGAGDPGFVGLDLRDHVFGGLDWLRQTALSEEGEGAFRLGQGYVLRNDWSGVIPVRVLPKTWQVFLDGVNPMVMV